LCSPIKIIWIQPFSVLPFDLYTLVCSFNFYTVSAEVSTSSTLVSALTVHVVASQALDTVYIVLSSSISCNLYSAIILRQCSDSGELLQAYAEAIPHSEEGTF